MNELNRAIQAIRNNRHLLNTQQMRTLKGQVLAGDIEGAMKGLHKLICRASEGDGA